MNKLDYTLARMKALTVTFDAGLRINNIEFDQDTESFFVYGVLFDQDPETYEGGKASVFMRVTNGKIDLVDGY